MLKKTIHISLLFQYISKLNIIINLYNVIYGKYKKPSKSIKSKYLIYGIYLLIKFGIYNNILYRFTFGACAYLLHNAHKLLPILYYNLIPTIVHLYRTMFFNQSNLLYYCYLLAILTIAIDYIVINTLD